MYKEEVEVHRGPECVCLPRESAPQECRQTLEMIITYSLIGCWCSRAIGPAFGT